MRYLRYLSIAAVLMVSAALAGPRAQAQVSFSVGVGVPVYGAAPACAYGYYNAYPYACAPYGYYGPEWFDGGVFIGVGPWYRGYGYRPYGYGYRGVYGYRGGYPGGYRGGYYGGYRRGVVARGPIGGGFRGGFGGGFRGGRR